MESKSLTDKGLRQRPISPVPSEAGSAPNFRVFLTKDVIDVWSASTPASMFVP